MNDNKERESSKQKYKKLQRIIDSKRTTANLSNHLRIIRKIIDSMVWMNKDRFTDSVLYEISKFVFKNPLCFIAPVFKHIDNKRLRIDSKKSYILVNTHLQKRKETIQNYNRQNLLILKSKQVVHANQEILNHQYRIIDSFKTGQYAINIKIQRCWKNCKINYANTTLKQIITKSKHFIQFLKNVKIDNPKQHIEILNKNVDSGNQVDKQAKLYTLICQNYDYILNKITQIQQNQKHKKLDNSIAKTYVEMMNKNIIILTVQKNNLNPITYKSQGKYIYIQNKLKLPLISQRFNRIYAHLESFKIDNSFLKFIPYIQYDADEWSIENGFKQKIQLFEQNGKQTDRGHGLIMDRYLNCFQYDDYLIQEV